MQKILSQCMRYNHAAKNYHSAGDTAVVQKIDTYCHSAEMRIQTKVYPVNFDSTEGNFEYRKQDHRNVMELL